MQSVSAGSHSQHAYVKIKQEPHVSSNCAVDMSAAQAEQAAIETSQTFDVRPAATRASKPLLVSICNQDRADIRLGNDAVEAAQLSQAHSTTSLKVVALVPHGASVGSKFNVHTPHGTFGVTVPVGAKTGSRLQVTVPAKLLHSAGHLTAELAGGNDAPSSPRGPDAQVKDEIARNVAEYDDDLIKERLTQEEGWRTAETATDPYTGQRVRASVNAYSSIRRVFAVRDGHVSKHILAGALRRPTVHHAARRVVGKTV
eukprot:SAG11_NODE_2138_length_3763_cov_2.690229_1_plen_257_part_00